LFEEQNPTFHIVEYVEDRLVGICVVGGGESGERRKNCILYN